MPCNARDQTKDEDYARSLMSEPILLQALKRKKIARTPVWVMRQAGRYLPEYRAARAKAKDFLTLCKTPALAKEVTMQPLRRFELDAAIVFSDILTIPDAMDLGLYFVDGAGPCLKFPITTVDNLENFDNDKIIRRLDYVMETLQLVRAELPQTVPLIGFAGSPFTIACYMIEGKSSRSFSKMLRLMYENEQDAHKLLNFLQNVISLYLKAQIQAGAQVIMIFDTWGGLLSPAKYLEFSLKYIQPIITDIKKTYLDIPIILFSKGVNTMFADIVNTNVDAISVDWTLDLGYVRRLGQGKIAVQGNLDPTVLLTNARVIETEVKKVLHAFGKGEGHVFNLGHGITPDVPPENLKAMIDAVRIWSPHYHE